ncbi:MAG: mismatch-specific DNA-glycosylase [Rhodobacteraceae bacterium]|nr:mismatch-specific DNA-glycosylase [Paracoccaceae bacterium]
MAETGAPGAGPVTFSELEDYEQRLLEIKEQDGVLPDVLKRGLDLVVCGTAAGDRSAAAGAYYVDGRNRFWRILEEVGLTPRQLAPEEFRMLPDFGIGLTDIVKHSSGRDAALRDGDYDIAGFREKIEAAQPQVLVFNGKNAAARYLVVPTGRLPYGRHEERVGTTILFVAPSTSGANAHWMSDPWHDCARLVRDIVGGGETSQNRGQFR